MFLHMAGMLGGGAGPPQRDRLAPGAAILPRDARDVGDIERLELDLRHRGSPVGRVRSLSCLEALDRCVERGPGDGKGRATAQIPAAAGATGHLVVEEGVVVIEEL